MTWYNKESHYVFKWSHGVDWSQIVIDSHFLRHLSESVPHESVHLCVGMNIISSFSCIGIVRFASWNSVLIGNAISEVADHMVEDEWCPNIVWDVRLLVSSWSGVSLDSKMVKFFLRLSQFKVRLGSHFNFSSVRNLLYRTHTTALSFSSAQRKWICLKFWKYLHVVLNKSSLVARINGRCIWMWNVNFRYSWHSFDISTSTSDKLRYFNFCRLTFFFLIILFKLWVHSVMVTKS